VKINYRRLAVLALVSLALSGAAFAQSFDHKLVANIPFNFYAGSKLLPAGSYTLGFETNNHTLAILQKGGNGGAFVFGSPEDASANGDAVLIFRSNGEGAYALERVAGPEFSLSFHSEKVLSDLADDRSSWTTETLVATLNK